MRIVRRMAGARTAGRRIRVLLSTARSIAQTVGLMRLCVLYCLDEPTQQTKINAILFISIRMLTSLLCLLWFVTIGALPKNTHCSAKCAPMLTPLQQSILLNKDVSTDWPSLHVRLDCWPRYHFAFTCSGPHGCKRNMPFVSMATAHVCAILVL